jgi:hypothetical protein
MFVSILFQYSGGGGSSSSSSSSSKEFLTRDQP